MNESDASGVYSEAIKQIINILHEIQNVFGWKSAFGSINNLIKLSTS